MSVNPGENLTDNSSLAEIQEAKRLAGASEIEAKTKEAVATQQTQVAHAQETEGKKQASALPSAGKDSPSSLSAPKAEGSNRAKVYGDVALEASGVGAVGQMASMLKDVISDTSKTFGIQHTSASDLAAKGSNFLGGNKSAGRSIFTGHFNDIGARGNEVGKFCSAKDSVKGAKASPQKTAEFTKQRELSVSAKLVSEKGLAIANKLEAKAGAKIAAAPRMGMGSAPAQLALNKYAPKPPKDIDQEAGSAANSSGSEWA